MYRSPSLSQASPFPCMLWQACPVVPDFVILGFDLLLQVIQAAGQRHARRADDDAIQVPSMVRLDHIAREDVFTHVGSVEDRDVRKRGVPGSVTKGDVS